MGQRGPVPERSDQKIRRNKDEVETEKVVAFGKVEVPELDLRHNIGWDFDELPTHPITKDLYESLADSAQARYFEPSDWQLARFALHFANQLLWSAKPNGQVLATITSLFSDLLMSEGSRRRLRMEIERKGDNEQTGQVIDVQDRFRQMLMEREAEGRTPEGSSSDATHSSPSGTDTPTTS